MKALNCSVFAAYLARVLNVSFRLPAQVRRKFVFTFSSSKYHFSDPGVNFSINNMAIATQNLRETKHWRQPSPSTISRRLAGS